MSQPASEIELLPEVPLDVQSPLVLAHRLPSGPMLFRLAHGRVSYLPLSDGCTETYKKALENNIQLTGSNVDYILEGVNRYLLELAKEQIRLAFEQSEKEVQDLHQRTREGIETARLNGKQIGRPKDSTVVTKKSIESKEVIRKLSKEFDGNLIDAEIMRLTGLARNTYYKYKRELKEEHKA